MSNSKSLLSLELEELLLVGMGAVTGALLRWQVALQLHDQYLLANILGSALLGLLVGLPGNHRRQLFLGIGFCGSFTTFSGWMLAATKKISMGDWTAAMGLIGCTLGLGLGAGLFGYLLGKNLSNKSLFG